MSTLSDTSQSNIGWVYPPQPQTEIVTVEEILGVLSGVVGLIEGQDYVDVVFGSEQPGTDWVPIETSIINTDDVAPLNVWPGVISDRTKTGFRLQLNGAADSGNYLLYWSIRGAFGYFFTGPTSGNTGSASAPFSVSLPEETTLNGTAIITLSDGGAGGTFTPSTVALTALAPSATFTYTPATDGTKTITVTNNRGLTNPASRSYQALHVTSLVVHDTFTDTNGVALPSHTMDLGSGWTRFKGSGGNHVTIQSNKAQAFLDPATEYAYSTESGISDATIEATSVIALAQNNHINMMIFRFVDASNYWACRVDGDGVMTLRKYVAGVETIVDTDSVSITAGVSFLFSVVLNGTSLAVTVNGVTVNATDSFNQTATKHGISLYVGTGALSTMDEFKVTG